MFGFREIAGAIVEVHGRFGDHGAQSFYRRFKFMVVVERLLDSVKAASIKHC